MALSGAARQEMLAKVGFASLDELADTIVPREIRSKGAELKGVPEPATESEAMAELKAKGVEFIDAHGGVIMPGFICAHHHLYSTFACGISCEPSANFVEILEDRKSTRLNSSH